VRHTDLPLLEPSGKILGSLPVPFNPPAFCRMAVRRATAAEKKGSRGLVGLSTSSSCPIAREQPTIGQLPMGETS